MSTDNPFRDPPENPFAANSLGDPRGHQEFQLPPDQPRGKINQVLILGILMSVNGGLLLLLGIGLLFGAVMMPEILKNNPAFENNPAFRNDPNMPDPEQFAQMLTLGYGIAGGLLSIIGLMNLVSGIMLTRFKGRIFAFVSLSVGLLTMLGVWCIPTAIGLFVYGLIVLLDRSVRIAFQCSARGHTPAEIQQAFARLPLGQ
jgi:hypothetical protein